MLVARVIRRQVGDHTQAARMRSAGQRLERLVATKQWIDPVECRRVVAMSAAGREDRREIDDVRAE